MISKALIYGFALILALGGFSAVCLLALRSYAGANHELSTDRLRFIKSVRKWLARSLALAIGIAALVLLLELALRAATWPDNSPGYAIKHPTRGHALRPDFSGYTYEAPLEINSLGIRDRDREVILHPNNFRVVVLGDAMTYGVGVPIEKTYPLLLEERLHQQGRSAQVFNFGVPNYNTVDEAIFLKEMFELYQPDFVILQFEMLGNDVAYKPHPLPQTGFRSTALWQQLRDIPRRSYVHYWTQRKTGELVFSYRRRHAPSDPLEKLQSSIEHRLHGEYAETAIGWLESQQALTQLNEFLAARKIPFMVAISVNFTDMSAEARNIIQPLTDQVSNKITGLGISPVVVIDEAFYGLAGRESELFLAPDDDHWTVFAHSQVADFLFDQMQSIPGSAVDTRPDN
ncbi:MAG: hypothetical protein RJQ07_00230 [Pseudomonadales bacterium]